MNEKDDNGKGEHEFSITVNARAKTVTSKELTFDQVLALAFEPVPTGDNWEFTVAFRRGQGNKPEGTLSRGETLKVKDGMIIDVTATDKS
jgi:hypothetical protein